MAERITVQSTIPDARAKSYLKTLKAIFPALRLTAVAVTNAYTVDAQMSKKECELVAERLTNPLVEESSVTRVLAPESYAYAIEIGYLPGVTDNAGHTARQTAEDCLGRTFKDGEAVYSSVFVFLTGEVTKQEAESAARELHNPLIERAAVYPAGANFKIVVPRVLLHEHTVVDEVNLDIDDAEL